MLIASLLLAALAPLSPATLSSPFAGYAFAGWAVLALPAAPSPALPATPSPPPGTDLDARTIYKKAMAHMRSFPISAVIRYHYTVVLDHHSKQKSYSYTVIERLRDHYGRFISLNPDGTESQDIQLRQTLVSPAFFLEPARPQEQDDGLKSIGEVVAAPYDAVLQGNEPAGTCSNAYRLQLSPVANPGRFPLRELWVDTETFRICRAKLIRSIYVITREPALVDLDVDANGFVDRWQLSGTGHFALLSYNINATGTFSDVTSLADADPGLFR